MFLAFTRDIAVLGLELGLDYDSLDDLRPLARTARRRRRQTLPLSGSNEIQNSRSSTSRILSRTARLRGSTF